MMQPILITLTLLAASTYTIALPTPGKKSPPPSFTPLTQRPNPCSTSLSPKILPGVRLTLLTNRDPWAATV